MILNPGLLNKCSKSGLWEEILDTLRKIERESPGRKPTPSVICADFQSIKTETESEDVGFDDGIFVDTLGILLAVVVTSTNTNDRDGYTRLFNFVRNAKDYELITRNSEEMFQISMIQILPLFQGILDF